MGTGPSRAPRSLRSRRDIDATLNPGPPRAAPRRRSRLQRQRRRRPRRCGGSAEEFCGDFQDLEESYAEDVDEDPEVVLDELDALEPPDDIADDYQQLIDALRETNTLDPASEEDVARAQEIAEETQEANENVSTFLAEECEIDTSAGP